MIRQIAITTLPTWKREYISGQRTKKLSARVKHQLSTALYNSAKKREYKVDIDPVSFARAFKPFREDMRLLSEQEQCEFECALQRYLAGALDSEEWRKIVSRLSALRRIAAQA